MGLYRVEIYKNYRSRDKKGSWSNVYELGALLDADIPVVAVPALVAAEREIHCDQVEFLRWTVGKFLAGTNKLDPAYAPKGGLIGTGVRPQVGQQVIDLETCFQVKLVTGGRAFGKKAYRGCLFESDVDGSLTGDYQLVNSSPLQPFGAAWAAYEGELVGLIGNGPDEAHLTAYTRFQTSARNVFPKTYTAWTSYPITALEFLKVDSVNRDHRWFNRAG